MMIEDQCDIDVVVMQYSYAETLVQLKHQTFELVVIEGTTDEETMLLHLLVSHLFPDVKKLGLLNQQSQHESKTLMIHPIFEKNAFLDINQLMTQSLIKLIQSPHYHDNFTLKHLDYQVAHVEIQAKHPLVHTDPKKLFHQVSEASQETVIQWKREDQCIDWQSSNQHSIQTGDHLLFAYAKSSPLNLIEPLIGHAASVQQIMLVGYTPMTRVLIATLYPLVGLTLVAEPLPVLSSLQAEFPDCVILHGKPDQFIDLEEENISQYQVFIAMSDHDHSNIAAALKAKQIGVAQVICMTKRPDYSPVIDESNIDIGICPEVIILDEIFQRIHGNQVKQAHTLSHQSGEIIELIIDQKWHDSPLFSLLSTTDAQCFLWFRDEQRLDCQNDQLLQLGDILCLWVKNYESQLKLVSQL